MSTSKTHFLEPNFDPTDLADLETRLESIENKIADQTLKLKQVVKILKGRFMEEIDFDSLLDSLDSLDEETPKPPETEAPEQAPEAPEQAPAVELEIPEPQEVPFMPELPDPPDTQEGPTNISYNEINEANQIIKDLKDELSNKIKELKVARSMVASVEAENTPIPELPELEYADEARSFLREYNELELQKRALGDSQKDLKDQYKELGVDIKGALKARNEVIKEIKETADEAQLVEGYKRIISEDESLMTESVIFAG